MNQSEPTTPLEAAQAGLEPRDMLEAMFERQRAFRDRVNPVRSPLEDNEHLTSEQVQHVEHEVQKYALCLMMEASELMDWTRWKHWSQQLGNKQPLDPGGKGHIYEMRVEIADLMCFLINAAFSLGMDAEMLNTYHAGKVGINHQRQDSGSY